MREEMRAGQTGAYPWRMPGGWWLKNQRYFLYMIRELTAVFAALWVVWFLGLIPMMGSGRGFQGVIGSMPLVVFNLVCLAFVLYHVATWFSLMGTVIYQRLGKTVISGASVTVPIVIVWFVVSFVIAAIIVAPIG